MATVNIPEWLKQLGHNTAQKQSDALVANTKPQKPPLSPEEREEYRALIEERMRKNEEERIKIFMSYPEEIRELHLEVLKKHLYEEMSKAMHNSDVQRSHREEELYCSRDHTSLYEVQREMAWHDKNKRTIDIYNDYVRAHGDACMNSIIENKDKDNE